jgi:hypothetical protein
MLNAPRVSRRTLAALIAAALVASAALAIAPAAYGGQWVQVSCANPDQSAAPPQGWTSIISGAPGDGSNNSTNCAPNSPMFGILSTTVAAAVGSGETLQYAPPSGSTLAGGSIDVSLYADGYGADASGTAVLYTPTAAYDAGDVFFQCVADLTACNGGSTDFSGVLALPANRGGDLFLAAACGGIAGQYCNVGGSNGAWSLVQLWWAELLLTNTSTPAATGFSGSLLSPDAHGTADIAFTATDPGGPGVYQVTVQIDGNTAYSGTPNTNDGSCAPRGTDSTTGALMFDFQQPCLQSEAIDLPIDTTGLSDGQHQLKVIVTDAAQNASTVLDQTITTANSTTVSALLNAPPPPAPATAPAPAPVLYGFSLDPATKALSAGVRRLHSASALRLAGTLESQTGVVAPGVAVALWAQPLAGGSFVELAHTTSDGAGRWTLTAPKGSSRLLRVVAGAGAQPTSSSSTVSVSETVTPTLTLAVRTPGRAQLVFTGQIGISPLGNPRPLVLIEVRGPKGWQAVGAPTRVGPHGRFRYVYPSSPLTIGRSFSFRATSPATSSWPTATSSTRTAVVH